MATIDDYELNRLEEKAKKLEDYEYRDKRLVIRGLKISIPICASVLLIIAFCVFGGPVYNVWKQEMEGKAKLAEAEYSKQVQIQEAQNNLEAEKLNAEAEVERAKGAAEARQAEGLGMSAEEYIQYLWVKKLSLADSKIIYLPTEGGIPTLTKNVDM